MQMLPKEKQPVAGSEGAQYRKKQLAKQLPAHDQDPSKCHELSPKEVKEMEQFVKKYKNEALGVGDVKLPREMDAQDPNRMCIPGGDRSTTAAVGAKENKLAENKRTQYVSRVWSHCWSNWCILEVLSLSLKLFWGHSSVSKRE